MPYNPNIHHRRSIRLKGYDYSQAGLYFVTICCQDRICRFGKIADGKMVLNDAGRMVEQWYLELTNKFPDIELGEYVIMPNHFHAIIINTGASVGAHLCVRPETETEPHVRPDHASGEQISGEQILGEHTGSPLHRVVQWFKTMTTNEYIRGVKTLNWQPFNKKLWQRNYWEHIIRNERSLQNISDYIINNPDKWDKDTFYYQQDN
jgi:REP element-mobilizing transposase RayT